jgi:Tfp pilus assembly protein PilO
MTAAVIATAILTTLCVALVGYAWRLRDELDALRIEAQTSDAWADYWQHKYERLRGELDSLQERYCDLVRNRLAHSYWIIQANRRRQPPP